MRPGGYDLDAAQRVAAGLRSFSGLDDDFVSAAALVEALGGDVDPRAPSGCRGQMQTSPFRAHYQADAAPQEQTEDIAHETGHFGMILEGRDRNEPEADAVGAMTLLPDRVMRKALQEHGWHFMSLVRAMRAKDVGPRLWAPRFTAVHECIIITRTGRGVRRVYAGPGLEHIIGRAGRWELEIIELARAADARAVMGQSYHRDLFGVTAWVLGPSDQPWSAIVLPPEAIERLEGRASPLLVPANDAPANGCDPAMAWWHAARVG